MQGNGAKAMRQQTGSSAAFTLVELLAAMAVLAIMMLMFANVFSSSGRAWTAGTRRTEQNMNGRAVLEYMTKEISQSIMNSNGIVFAMAYDTAGSFSSRSYFTNTALHFVAMRGCDSDTYPDEARLIHYYVRQDPTSTSDGFRPYQLMRAECRGRNTIDQAYQSTTRAWLTQKTGTGWLPPSVIVDNISQFYVVAYRRNTAYVNYQSYGVVPQSLPDYVDVVIGFLSEDDARRARMLTGGAQQSYVTKAEKRFTRRVYMQNRVGYLPLP
jgi:prepilin-type N-terminal cleavage/methylation domain-containing protein